MPRIRVLQTSDLHLRPDRPDLLAALDRVLETAQKKAADLVIIAGDLFDRTARGTELQEAVRKRIEALAPISVVLLPGNHDRGIYDTQTDLGTNATILHETPHQTATVCGLEIVGVPYQHGRSLAECLVGQTMDPLHTILVAHGTLVNSVEDSFYGEGEDGAYMPIFPTDLRTRCCYAALGHLHSGSSFIRREGERLTSYSGSPVTTSHREIGRRGVLLVDVEPGVGVVSHEFLPLLTPFFERVEVVCQPGGERAAIELLARRAADLRKPGAQIIARLAGIALESEVDLRKAAQDELDRAFARDFPEEGESPPAEAGNLETRPVLELATTSFDTLAEIPVISEFVERVQSVNPNEEASDLEVRQAALQLGLAAFREMLP